jgi:hypothetical protein
VGLPSVREYIISRAARDIGPTQSFPQGLAVSPVHASEWEGNTELPVDGGWLDDVQDNQPGLVLADERVGEPEGLP